MAISNIYADTPGSHLSIEGAQEISVCNFMSQTPNNATGAIFVSNSQMVQLVNVTVDDEIPGTPPFRISAGQPVTGLTLVNCIGGYTASGVPNPVDTTVLIDGGTAVVKDIFFDGGRIGNGITITGSSVSNVQAH